MVTAFHGTNKKNASLILKNGFNEWSYFTNQMDSAIGFGGPYVFGVLFEKEFDYWQYRSPERIPVDRILFLKKFTFKEIYSNEENFLKLRFSNMENPCKNCNGTGEVFSNKKLISLFSKIPFIKKIMTTGRLCPECRGWGDLARLSEYTLNEDYSIMTDEEWKIFSSYNAQRIFEELDREENEGS